MLVYSGARLKHVYDALKDFNPANTVIVNDKVAIYPTSSISKGAKKSYWLFFPKKFIDELKELNITVGYSTIQKHLAYKRVNAETIKKWHFNFMIIENDVPESVADFIQGRRPVTVGSAHYLNKTKDADKHYARMVDKFPIPP